MIRVIEMIADRDLNEMISIIIPCIDINQKTIKCIGECLNLDYDEFEIIVLPDQTTRKSKHEKLKIIETGKVKPALKRNIGMDKANGKYFAFIDDDAYPKKDWLKNAVRYFEDGDEGYGDDGGYGNGIGYSIGNGGKRIKSNNSEKIGIVGGPNLTPEDSNFEEKVSGYVLSNYFVSGRACIRYKIAKNENVNELPSCNYISRKLGIKYDHLFLTAEDSKFCFDYIKEGYKVLYASDVVVYHHRRDSFKKHIKQMFIYGRDIAWLTKKEFSWDKMHYSLLSLFVIGFFIGLLGSFFNDIIKNIFSILLFIYFIIMLFTSIHKNVKTSWLVFITSIATHFSYGIGWLKGIFSSPEKTAEVSWISR